MHSEYDTILRKFWSDEAVYDAEKCSSHVHASSYAEINKTHDTTVVRMAY